MRPWTFYIGWGTDMTTYATFMDTLQPMYYSQVEEQVYWKKVWDDSERKDKDAKAFERQAAAASWTLTELALRLYPRKHVATQTRLTELRIEIRSAFRETQK